MPRQEDTIWKVKGLNPDEGDNIFFILKSLLKSILYIILWNLCIVALYNCDLYNVLVVSSIYEANVPGI